jgi:hypothetical protein
MKGRLDLLPRAMPQHDEHSPMLAVCKLKRGGVYASGVIFTRACNQEG